MTASQARQLVDDYLDAYNCLDAVGMLTSLHSDVKFENIADGVVTLQTEGKAAFAAQAKQAVGWFMERNQHIKEFHFQDNRAEADIDYFAITAVDLPNGLKAGTVLQLTGKSIFTFRDELIDSIQDIS